MTKTAIVALNEMSLIAVSGQNAATFLQGQLTCDVTHVSNTTASLGACCDHKGRMIANFCIWRIDDTFRILLPTSLTFKLIQHLQKYAVFSKVKVEQPADLSVLAAFGPGISKNSNPFLQNQSIQMLAYVNLDHHILICGNSKSLSQIQPTQHFLVWQLANIQAGIAFLYPQTSGQFTPQMIDLQLFDGVSFTKGCYVGQEVIARTQHLGKLKRHLHRFHVTQENSPQPGDILKNKDQQVLGVIVNAVQMAENEFLVLAVIQDRALPDDLFLNGNKIETLERANAEYYPQSTTISAYTRCP